MEERALELTRDDEADIKWYVGDGPAEVAGIQAQHYEPSVAITGVGSAPYEPTEHQRGAALKSLRMQRIVAALVAMPEGGVYWQALAARYGAPRPQDPHEEFKSLAPLARLTPTARRRGIARAQRAELDHLLARAAALNARELNTRLPPARLLPVRDPGRFIDEAIERATRKASKDNVFLAAVRTECIALFADASHAYREARAAVDAMRKVEKEMAKAAFARSLRAAPGVYP